MSELTYRVKLQDLDEDETNILFDIEGKHIREYDQELYLQLVYYPA